MTSTPVQKELRKIAADYRRYRILRGLAGIWAAAAALGVLFLASNRLLGLAVPYSIPILLGTAFIAALVVLRRHSRTDVALREIARLIERDDPKLNTLLLAAAEQQPDAQTGELNFLQIRVIREAIEANNRSPWSAHLADRLRFVQVGHLAALCAFTAILVACALISKNHPANGIFARLGSGVEITPGNVSVEKGSSVAILAKFQGAVPGQVHLVYQTAGGEEKKLVMARSLSDPLFGVTLPELQEKTLYRIEYGGKQSQQYTADIFEYPDLKRADADLKFPAYTGFAASKIEDTRRISAVEGTDVRYSFFLNKPVRSARLLGTNQTQIVLTNNGANAVSYETDFRLLESGQYKLELVDEAGRTNKIPPDFVFVALENQRPKLKLKAPHGDQRVSALEEVAFNAQAEDDFGLSAYGLAYRLAGQETKLIKLSDEKPAQGLISKPHESREFSWMLALEKLKAQPEELVSYYLWADDLGPDGKPRRTESDMFFAEVRPFEEIFREGDSNNGQQQQQQQQQQNPATKLLELQKQIISATWNLQRREIGAKPTSNFKKDTEVVRDSQQQAWQQAQELKEKLSDDKSHAIIGNVITAMDSAVKNLRAAATQNAPKDLPPAVESEQTAYQGLMRLQAHEYQVSRSRSSGGQQQNSRGERAQRQLDQLEIKNDQNRYETESQATPLQSPEQRETLQVLNRLKELARRQQDMSERLKELQSALNEAKTKDEKEKLERMLKRLQEEQQQIVQDTDELRQRMSQPENQSRMSEAQKELDKSREQSRQAAQQLQQGNVGQALSSSSRAQQQLQQLSNDLRKSTSSQFAEQMRNLRQEARDLTEKHEELEKKLEETPESRQRTLSDQGPQKEIKDGLAQQRAAFTNILENMRQVTEQAESAEPLLAKELYDTWRKASQADPDKNFQMTSQALDRNLLPLARDAYKRTDPPLRDLRQGVEQAARDVLGDEAESLRYAQKELQDLAERVQKELNRAVAGGSTNANGTNAMAGAAGERGTNSAAAFAQAGSTNRTGLRGERGQNGQPQPGEQGQRGEMQLASNNAENPDSPDAQQSGRGTRQNNSSTQRGQRNGQRQQQNGQPGAQQNGDQQSAEQNGQEQADTQQQGEQQGQQGQAQGKQQGQQQGQRGQQGQQGQQSQRGQQGLGQGGQQGQPGRQPQNGQQQGGARFFEQWANGGGTGGGAVNTDGPLTGENYGNWSDRMRDVEEVLQDPQLRNQAAQILDRARAMRMEFKKRGITPRWDMVDSGLIKPMRILQSRVAEELARQGNRDAVVPVDRDPVPQKYTDLVSRYYERLGKE